MALGYRRHGLLPHPFQVAVGEQIRQRILTALSDATDVVISHYHGDHVPMVDANPFQIQARQATPRWKHVHLWTKGPEGISSQQLARREALSKLLGKELPNAEGLVEGGLRLSPPMPHGEPHSTLGTLMMTRVEADGTVFVHASDIQLLDEQAVSLILDWEPDIALVGGPPLYLSDFMNKHRQQRTWKQALRLANGIETLILDHHLLRCEAGLVWLDRLSSETDRRVICAADFMGLPRCLLEAKRVCLYKDMPVPGDWHQAYERAEVDTRPYRNYPCR
jgi:predicted metallo-beta-lactamase superfamily hydrolase